MVCFEAHNMKSPFKLPAHYVPMLVDLGFVEPASSPAYMDDRIETHNRLAVAEWICTCGGRSKHCDLVPLQVDDDTQLIGQCSVCREIRVVRWHAPDRYWLGMHVIGPSRPVHDGGLGVV